MKITFSTLGCPNWSWGEILAAARDLQYDGIELRGLGQDLYMPGIERFAPAGLPGTRADLERKKLMVSCVSSDCLLHSEDSEVPANVRKYIDLAAGLGAPYVRVLCDDWGHPGENVDAVRVATRLKEFAPYAADKGVTLLVETNGVWANTKRLRGLIDEVGHPNVRVLWDINHPAFYFGESPETTYANVGEYIGHVHVKDSVRDADGKLVYKMLGYGELPLTAAFGLLKKNGFDGALSLEWTKRWNEELEDAGIVFSHFIYQVKRIWHNA